MGKANAKTKYDTSRETRHGAESGNQTADAATMQRDQDIYGAAQNAANAGAPSSVTGAADYYKGAQGYGQQGQAALNGDAGAAAQYMNPYQSQVVDQMTKQFGQQNQATANQMNDAATAAGAFGGSRHGVATGVALAQNQQNQAAQLAGLMQTGFNGAMDRAGQAAGMGMQAAGAGANLGMTAGNPDLWKMNVLQQGRQGATAGRQYKNNTSGSVNRNSAGFEGTIKQTIV